MTVEPKLGRRLLLGLGVGAMLTPGILAALSPAEPIPVLVKPKQSLDERMQSELDKWANIFLNNFAEANAHYAKAAPTDKSSIVDAWIAYVQKLEGVVLEKHQRLTFDVQPNLGIPEGMPEDKKLPAAWNYMTILMNSVKELYEKDKNPGGFRALVDKLNTVKLGAIGISPIKHTTGSVESYAGSKPLLVDPAPDIEIVTPKEKPALPRFYKT